MTIAQIRGNAIRVAEHRDRSRCQVAATACLFGFQSLRVEARSPSFANKPDGVVSIRVGHVLIYLEDRDAMHSLVTAVQRAMELQDSAFGPELPTPATGPKRKAA